MLYIKFICVGKLKEQGYKSLCAEYMKRLRAFCRAELTELPEGRTDILLKEIPKDAFITAMCIEGEELTSEEFSRFVTGVSMRASKLCFIIGGSDGLPETVKRTASRRISFSKMTFPHHLFRVMLLEQVYRAFMIDSGKAYHK